LVDSTSQNLEGLNFVNKDIFLDTEVKPSTTVVKILSLRDFVHLLDRVARSKASSGTLLKAGNILAVLVVLVW